LIDNKINKTEEKILLISFDETNESNKAKLETMIKKLHPNLPTGQAGKEDLNFKYM
jgi:hypothetical protein